MINAGEPFTRAQAPELGLRSRDLVDAVAAKELRRLFRGVYLDGATDLSVEVRARAALLVTPPGAVVSDRTASWVQGLDLSDFNDMEMAGGIDLLVPAPRAPIRRPGVRSRAADLPDRDVRVQGELVVTNEVRTCADLARYAGEGWGLAAVDAYLRAGLVTAAELDEILARYPGERGIARARANVANGDAGAESPMESWTRWRFLGAGLPRPRTQVELDVGGYSVWLDMGYDEYRAGADYDGAAYHSGESGGHDYRRRRRIADQGWSLLAFTSDSVLGARPVAALVMAELLMKRGWVPDPAVGRRLESLARRWRWNT